MVTELHCCCWNLPAALTTSSGRSNRRAESTTDSVRGVIHDRSEVHRRRMSRTVREDRATADILSVGPGPELAGISTSSRSDHRGRDSCPKRRRSGGGGSRKRGSRENGLNGLNGNREPRSCFRLLLPRNPRFLTSIRWHRLSVRSAFSRRSAAVHARPSRG